MFVTSMHSISLGIWAHSVEYSIPPKLEYCCSYFHHVCYNNETHYYELLHDCIILQTNIFSKMNTIRLEIVFFDKTNGLFFAVIYLVFLYFILYFMMNVSVVKRVPNLS